MSITFKRFICIMVCLNAFLSFSGAIPVRAEDTLPQNVQMRSHANLEKVGSGHYRRFGFSIYHITLWAPQGVWDAAKPYALELHYERSLSKSTMVDAVMSDIRDQDVADDATLAQWEQDITQTIPAVEEGDVMIGLAVPGTESVLFLNAVEIGKLQNDVLSHAFFNIWLGENADEDLKEALLKPSK